MDRVGEDSHGAREINERPAQILALDGKLRETRCSGVSHTSDFLVRLESMQVELQLLGHSRSDEVEKAASHFGNRDALPHLFD